MRNLRVTRRGRTTVSKASNNTIKMSRNPAMPATGCVIMNAYVVELSLSERIFERRALRCKEFSAVFSNVHIVFQADPEFSADVNPGLIAERHIRCKRQSIAADQVRPLVSVHSDAVTEPMGEVFVIRTVAGVCDHLARGRVHRLSLYSGLCGRECRRLRTMHDLKVLLHLVARLAKDEGAADVRFVSFSGAATVDEQDRSFANHLRLHRAVRQGRVLPNLNPCATLESQL